MFFIIIKYFVFLGYWSCGKFLVLSCYECCAFFNMCMFYSLKFVSFSSNTHRYSAQARWEYDCKCALLRNKLSLLLFMTVGHWNVEGMYVLHKFHRQWQMPITSLLNHTTQGKIWNWLSFALFRYPRCKASNITIATQI